MRRDDIESELRKRLLVPFPASHSGVNPEERTKIVVFSLLLDDIKLESEEELDICLNILSNDVHLLAAVKSVLVSVSFSGGMGGHLTESMSLKVMQYSNAIQLLAKLGVPKVEFHGVHCTTFFEVGHHRKSMSVDLYIRHFLPKFIRNIMNTSERFMLYTLLYPIALTLFQQGNAFQCQSRDRMVASVVKGSVELIRPLRKAPLNLIPENKK
ncbi:conserved hypothetical protein [Echinococcus multilocularis]|uniref:Uncharacterized protein n=1 Tax=Echinococcus multilocularis TaxID=6211 RepID=A0A068Y1N9_ECHMU|nr:conserved hypothetical protein [Echinococcus multilocularis]